MAVETLIKGGLIVDGSGSEPFEGDVAIRDGVIVDVGRVAESASRVIDAAGLAVAPGFWDVHTHYDAQLLWDPIATSSCWHGVTTVVMGNCGFTIAPCRPDDQEWMVKTLARVEGMDADVLRTTLPWQWEDFGGYLDTLDRALGVNAIAQVGHTAVRRYVMGREASEREATADEVERMREVLADSLKAGGTGFSTSRIVTHWDGDGLPVPSRLASLEGEYLSLLQELRKTGIGFVQAAAGLGPDGAAAFARAAGKPVCLNGIVAQPGKPDSWKARIADMERLRHEGIDVFALGHCMPTDREFDFRYTNVFDRWALWQKVLIEPHDAKVAMLSDPQTAQALKDEMADDPIPQVPVSWDGIILVESKTGRHRDHEGMLISDLGKKLGKHPQDAAFDIALDEDLETRFRLLDARRLPQDAMLGILKSPHVVPGMSDAGAHLITEVNTAFPTVVLSHWVREKKAMTLAEGVRLLSAAAAEEAGVSGRGLIAQGHAADVTVFDPETVAPTERKFASDFPGGARRLVQGAKGYEYTLVNGTVTMEGGRHTGALRGKTLRGTYAG